MQYVLDTVSKVSTARTTVLITGETGTGKELIAKAIHANSPRADRPFVDVNSGALPPDLLESTLFGHVKGAFTGAVSNRKGYFETANHGTIFFDEIGTLTADMQAKLLRVIQEREFMPVGSNESVHVDVRIVAATNAELQKLVEEGRFRQDLYFRLNVIPLKVPPMAQRREDIPLLVEEFLQGFSRRSGLRAKRVSEPAMRTLQAYDWPGNVREIRNVVERLMIMVTEDEIGAEHVQLTPGVERRAWSGEPATLKEARESFERDYIELVIHQCGNNMSQAARLLGLERSHFYRKLRALGLAPIDRPQVRG
jgi:two-component system nitrogen regulation response regulator NtrX